MMKKMSTTWGLRQMMDQTGLNEVPNAAAAEEEAGVLAAATSPGKSLLKRKATVLNSPPASAMRKSAMVRGRSIV